MSIEYKEKSTGQKVLSHIAESTGELFKIGATMLFNPHAFLNRSHERPPSNFKQTMYQMKRTGYLEEKAGKLYVTEKGRIKVIKKVLKNKQKTEKKKWDGKWRGIIFDIPEVSRKERNFLRRELEWLGLIEAQHSVWLFPFDIEKELKALLKLWQKDFEGDIRFILIEKMDDTDLKERFNLK